MKNKKLHFLNQNRAVSKFKILMRSCGIKETIFLVQINRTRQVIERTPFELMDNKKWMLRFSNDDVLSIIQAYIYDKMEVKFELQQLAMQKEFPFIIRDMRTGITSTMEIEELLKNQDIIAKLKPQHALQLGYIWAEMRMHSCDVQRN